MGGVYRIQTFLDFYIFFYIYKAPNMLANKRRGLQGVLPVVVTTLTSSRR